MRDTQHITKCKTLYFQYIRCPYFCLNHGMIASNIIGYLACFIEVHIKVLLWGDYEQLVFASEVNRTQRAL